MVKGGVRSGTNIENTCVLAFRCFAHVPGSADESVASAGKFVPTTRPATAALSRRRELGDVDGSGWYAASHSRAESSRSAIVAVTCTKAMAVAITAKNEASSSACCRHFK